MTHTATTTTREAFHTHLREIERLHNAGTTTRYHEACNTTAWLVAGRVVGLSTGRIGNGMAYRIITEEP
jgi:hypothetical protein